MLEKIQECVLMYIKINVRVCVATQVEYCLRVCERIWVMARAGLGRTAGLSHFSRKRSGGDKLTPIPRAGEEEEGEEKEIRACFPMLPLRQEPAGRML